jgi:hypothetical protein
MIAIQVEKPHALALVEQDQTTPGSGEVLVRVRRAGICGSDVHILHGSNPSPATPALSGTSSQARSKRWAPTYRASLPATRWSWPASPTGSCPAPASSTRGRRLALPSLTRDRSPVPKSGTPGSVRGAGRKTRPYRD